MRCSRLAAIALLIVVLPGSGHSFTDEEIDAAAQAARDIDIVEVIAADVFAGRAASTPGSFAVQELLIDALSEVAQGLDASQIGDDAYRQPFVISGVAGTNLLGVIPGTDLAHEYVMVGAHYDHLGSSGTMIFNGATDNAAGVAVVLAVGSAVRALPSPPRRSIILALWDAEEFGLLGSQAYRAAPLVPLSSTVAYLNMDIQGANLLPSLRNRSFAIGAESGGAALRALVAEAVARQAVDARQATRIVGQERSDHATFIDSIPSVFFTDATGACYHTPEDKIGVVDKRKLSEQAQIVFRAALALSETPTPPPLSPTSPSFATATYGDAVELSSVATTALADLDLFPLGSQTTLLGAEATLRNVVDAGPGMFDFFAILDVVFSTLDLLQALGTVECDGHILVEPLEIDIKPGTSLNPLNLGSHGVVPVAILGSETLDVGQIDPTTLAFGPGRANPKHKVSGHVEDVDGDGLMDLVSHYRTQETAIALGDDSACVSAELLDGTRAEGCDAVQPQIPGACGVGFELGAIVGPLLWLRRRRK